MQGALKNIQDTEVSKPLFSIHISNDLSLFERKVMNTLIRHIHNIESTTEKIGKYVTPQGNYYEFTFGYNYLSGSNRSPVFYRRLF